MADLCDLHHIVMSDPELCAVHMMVLDSFRKNQVYNAFLRLQEPIFWDGPRPKFWRPLVEFWWALGWHWKKSHEEISGYGGPGNHTWCYMVWNRSEKQLIQESRQHG